MDVNNIQPNNFVEEFNKNFPHSRYIREVDTNKFVEVETINIGDKGGMGLFDLANRTLKEDEFFHLPTPVIQRSNYFKNDVINLWFEYYMYHNMVTYYEEKVDGHIYFSGMYQAKSRAINKIFVMLNQTCKFSNDGIMSIPHDYKNNFLPCRYLDSSYDLDNHEEYLEAKRNTLIYYNYLKDDLELISRDTVVTGDSSYADVLWDLEIKIYKKKGIEMFNNKVIKSLGIELKKGFEFTSEELKIKVEKKDVTFTKVTKDVSSVTTVTHEEAKTAINKLIVGKKVSELSEAQQRLISLDNIITNVELASDTSAQIEEILG